MGLINVTELKPDMVLAEGLKNSNGRFLLPKGTKLASKHLRVLKIWGVIEAEVEGVSQKDVAVNTAAQLDPAITDQAIKVISKRFSHTDLTYPPISELFRLCTLREAEKISGTNRKVNSECQTYKEDIDLDPIPENAASGIDPQKLIGDSIRLPSLPTIFIRINETIKKPTSSANEIAKVISKDTSLSARLLKIVNSPFYGFPSSIDTLTRAVAVIGTKQLTTLALGINMINVFKNIPSDLIDMKLFWEHSVACGISARIIAGYKNIQNTERLFVAGLLHDIGRLILYNNIPVQAGNALLKARHDEFLLNETEYETMGFDHTKIGGLLLKKWKLPISLENIIRYHHAPQKSKDPLEPAIVHLADIVTNALGVGSSGEHLVPPLDPDAWECIGLSENILELTIDQMYCQIEEITRFLFSDE